MVKKELKSTLLIENIVSGIEEVKGQGISIMDLREIENSVCDYFILCTGSSNIHVQSIVNSIKKFVSRSVNEKPYQTEGHNNAEWVLMDYIDVVVHVFQNHIRDFYNLESLWGDAKSIKLSSN